MAIMPWNTCEVFVTRQVWCITKPNYVNKILIVEIFKMHFYI
jgi:hypothetical protein